MTLRFRSPVNVPLLRAGTPKPVPPDPRAHDTFRVTQQFDSPDAYHRDGRKHNATDIGNFRCGDPVLAMAPGRARRVKDNATALGAKTDALGIVIDHGHGITTEYWHLNGWTVSDGQMVAAGQQIGIVGRTGLGDVCHVHVEAKRNGIKFDPEPLMFGGSVSVEDSMQVAGTNLRHVQNRQARLTTNSWFRPGPGRKYGTITDEPLPVEALLYPIAVVEGEAIGTAADRADWYYAIKTAGVAGSQLGCVHSSVLPRTADGQGVALVPIEQADCRALETTVTQLRTKIARARTANAGVRQGSDAVEASLA